MNGEAMAVKTGDGTLRTARKDLAMLTKVRLSVLVVTTTLIGFILGSRSSGGGIDGWLLLHTLFGTGLAAFASAAFNQLMEIGPDARMKRTEDRPLPARRMTPEGAFAVGWVLAAIGLIHLALKVNVHACFLTGLTLLIYLFVYTPMKERSNWNTVVGAVAGAIPPVIGWVAAGGGYGVEAAFLFSLQFLWQMPHFLAINWMYREEYIRGGFVMWSNDDEDGGKTSGLAVFYSVLLVLLMAVPVAAGFAGWISLAGGAVLSGMMLLLSIRFRRARDRASARRLFLFTLVYLPLTLGVMLIAWK